jgi:dephospho-CoA kinase
MTAHRFAGVRRIGLTGGIGSGKSTVAGLLQQRGAVLVDTDASAHQLSAPGGAAVPALRAAFGDALIDGDGGLDRAKMRSMAFSDPQVRARLEAILHPMIGAQVAQLAAAAGDKVVVFDVPLLVESGRWRSRIDRVLVIDCEVTTQVERVTRRAGWALSEVRRVIAQQASRERRRACADAVLFNDGISLATLEVKVNALWQSWCGCE